MKAIQPTGISRPDDLVLYLLLGYLYVALPLFLVGSIGAAGAGLAYLLSGLGFSVTIPFSHRVSARLGPDGMLLLRNLLTAISLLSLYPEAFSPYWPVTLAPGFVTLLGGVAGALDHSARALYNDREAGRGLHQPAFLIGASIPLFDPRPALIRPLALLGGVAMLILSLSRLMGGRVPARPAVRSLPLYPSEKRALTRLAPIAALYGLAFGAAVLPTPLWLYLLKADIKLVAQIMTLSILVQFVGRALQGTRAPLAPQHPSALLALIHALLSQTTHLTLIGIQIVTRGVLLGIVSGAMAERLRQYFRPATEPMASGVTAALLAGFGGAGMLTSLLLAETLAFTYAMGLAAACYALASLTTWLLEVRRLPQPRDDTK